MVEALSKPLFNHPPERTLQQETMEDAAQASGDGASAHWITGWDGMP